MRVLHVAEAFGGGVATAISSYVRNADMFEHVVAVHPRRDHDIGGDIADLATVVTMDGSKPRQAIRIRHLVREVSPDVVHLHSSWAGFLGRLSARGSSTGVPVIYSPHCFAFERRDVSRACAGLYRLVERGLAPRVDAFAVVGEHEAALAASLLPFAPVTIIPHAVDTPRPARPRPATAGHRIRVATLGRITPQKDPGFFLSVVSTLREILLDNEVVDFVWIGGGTPEDEWRLTSRGVEVTGWLPRDRALAVLGASDVYVHCAQWEAGVPLALIEAARLGLPVVARDIPALAGGPFYARSTPGAIARHIVELFDPTRRALLGRRARELSLLYCAETQRAALYSLYSSVMERAAERTAA